MKFRFLNKTIENKRFKYSPLYYDEQKEYLELKKAQYRDLGDEEQSIETRKAILKQELSASWSRAQHATQARKTSNIRVLILIGIIILLGYVLLYGIDNVDTVVEKMW